MFKKTAKKIRLAARRIRHSATWRKRAKRVSQKADKQLRKMNEILAVWEKRAREIRKLSDQELEAQLKKAGIKKTASEYRQWLAERLKRSENKAITSMFRAAHIREKLE